MKGKFICSVLIFTFLSSGIALGNSDHENTIALLPVEYKIELARGNKDLLEFRIANRTRNPLTFLVYPTDCFIDRQGGREYPPKEEASKYSAAGWIELLDLQKENVVYSGNERAFRARIRVPRNADPGWYYATIMAELMEISYLQQGKFELGIQTRIAALIKVRVLGPISAFRTRLNVTEIVPIMPDRDKITRYEKVIRGIEENKIIAEDIAEELWRLLFEQGHMFDYEKYSGLEKKEREGIATSLKKYMEQEETKEETVKLRATVENESHMILLAKIKCFIYQKLTKNGRIKRILKDKFTLTPSGKDVKGEGKVFPGRLRDFYGTIDRPLTAGEYTIEARIEYQGEEDEKIKLARGTSDFIITEDIALRQREILVLDVDPDLLEFKMVPGGIRSKGVEIENLDLVENLEVTVSSNAGWLIVSSPRFILGPGRRKKIRVVVRIKKPTKNVERNGKIRIKTERGKPVYVDVVVKNAR